jgi:hypothetical protein
VRSQEQLAWSQFRKLDVRDQMNVLDWMALGNPCQDAMISSGVLTGPRPTTGRLTPSEFARQQEYDRQFGKLVEQRIKNLLPNEVSRRRQTAEHEAAHAVCVLAFGKALRSISINDDDPSGGLCSYEKGLTPLETAITCVAPIVWLEQIRYQDYPHYLANGATGCESDLRKAQNAVGCDMNFEFGRAFRQSRELLLAEYDSVMAIADRLDRDGEYKPYPTSPRVRGYGAS